MQTICNKFMTFIIIAEDKKKIRRIVELTNASVCVCSCDIMGVWLVVWLGISEQRLKGSARVSHAAVPKQWE